MPLKCENIYLASCDARLANRPDHLDLHHTDYHWTHTYFLSQLPKDKSRENNTYMSHSAIILPDGSTTNWQEAFWPCMNLASRKHIPQATSFHRKDCLWFFNFDTDFQVNLTGECCLLVPWSLDHLTLDLINTWLLRFRQLKVWQNLTQHFQTTYGHLPILHYTLTLQIKWSVPNLYPLKPKMSPKMQ